MRIAVVGLGGAGVRGHLPAIAALGGKAELIAVADRDPRRRELAAIAFPRVQVFAGAEELLATARPDVLVVATEPGAHAALVSLGLRHGVHVVCEKPLTVTPADHEQVARACACRPDLAVVPVHQYRYSRQWGSIARWARQATRMRVPYTLAVDVRRTRPDRHAVTGWRSSVTGGMLADAGVHFLALAWTIRPRLDVVAHVGDAHGRQRAIVGLGSGVLSIETFGGAASRRTSVRLGVGGAALTWCDETAVVRVGGRDVRRRRVDALSDRGHVDALYVPFYRDLAHGLGRDGWRRRRTTEALGVDRALMTLLARV